MINRLKHWLGLDLAPVDVSADIVDDSGSIYLYMGDGPIVDTYEADAYIDINADGEVVGVEFLAWDHQE